jgi:predicted acetyltransferase
LRSFSSSTGGVGAVSDFTFSRQLMTRFPGPWRLHELANNQDAIAFWRRVLGGFALYTETSLRHADGIERIEQRFVVS